MHRTSLIWLFLGAGVIAGCSADAAAPTAPRALPTTAAFEEGGNEPCGDEINICDDITYTDDGYEETYGEEEGGDGSAYVITASTASYGSAPFCPSGFSGMWTHNINVPTPQGTKVYKPVSMNGLHALILESPVGIGSFSLPPGYWPAADGSGVEVQVQSAKATCTWSFPQAGTLRIDLNFYRYFQINTRWPRRRGISNDGGGGGGGGGGCRTEYVYLEVDYGDGTGWHVIWEGYAQVCG